MSARRQLHSRPSGIDWALPAFSGLLSLAVGLLITKPTGTSQLVVTALVVLAGAVFVLSLAPTALFLPWFALAPLLQASPVTTTGSGRLLVLGLYIGPTLVLAVWTLWGHGLSRRPRALDALPLGYFLYVLGALLLTGYASSSLFRAVYTNVGIAAVLYYFFAFGPIGSLSWTNVTGTLLALCTLEGGMGIVDGLTGWNLWHDTGWQGPGVSRAVATLANPAVLGLFLGMGLVLAVSILVWHGPRRLRSLAIATILIGVPGLFFTYTRAPILAAAIGAFIVLMSRVETRWIGAALIVVTGLVLALSWGRITSSTIYRDRVTNQTNVQARVLLEDWSFKLAARKPVFGWGYNSFDRAKAQEGFTAQDVQQFGVSSTSHNSYLTVLVQYGSVGLLLLTIPWLAIGWRAIRDVALRPELRWFTVGTLGLLFVFVVDSNAGDFRYFSFVPALPWIFLGFLRRRQLAEG